VIGLSHVWHAQCTYGVCGLGPTPCKLAPHCLQGFTGMAMCRPCIEVALRASPMHYIIAHDKLNQNFDSPKLKN
jgi:hypothetical protein